MGKELNDSEAKVQQSCVMWFRNTYELAHHAPRLLMFSVPNEDIDPRARMKKKATGALAGVSDTIIDTGEWLVYCEFKDAKGAQKEEQKKFQERVEALGRKYWLIRDKETFQEKVIELIGY